MSKTGGRGPERKADLPHYILPHYICTSLHVPLSERFWGLKKDNGNDSGKQGKIKGLHGR